MARRTPRARMLAAIAGGLAVPSILPGRIRAAQFEFKFASNEPYDDPSNTRVQQMWAAVNRESNGRIHTQVFANSQLGGDAAMLAQLRVGAIDFNYPTGGVLSSVVPVAGISYTGYAFNDEEEAARAFDGPLGEYVRQEAATKGLYLFRNIYSGGMLQVGANRPIRSPDEFRGFKIRTIPAKITVDLFKALGANPAPLDYKETYTALQTKLIDGEAGPLVSLYSGRLYELNKYMVMTNAAWSSNWLIANADSWKSLPPDLQAIVERNAAKYCLIHRRDTKTVNANLVETMRRKGLTIVEGLDPQAFRRRLGAYYDEWSAFFGATAWGYLKKAVAGNLG